MTPQERAETELLFNSFNESLCFDDTIDLTSPVDYLEHEVYIPETQQPLVLANEQRAVIEAMFATKPDGSFKYQTMVYSAPKKSGKTQVGAGLALWQAERIPHGEIYIVGNDLKQADNRMNQAIRYSIAANPRTQHIKPIRNTIHMPNGTRIEAVPVDPVGEAGSNPTGIFWTEAWGAKQRKHEEMWTEMALSPTRMGNTFKFIESYAGHIGESGILERLYEAGVKEGQPHPTIPELYINGSLIVYWCTRYIMPWQQGLDFRAFLAREAREKTPNEFRRQYGNEWVSGVDVFVPDEWWQACKQERLPLERNTPIILGVDAAVTSDCFAIVGVSRHDLDLAVRYARIWTPPPNGEIDFTADDGPEHEIRRLCATYNIKQIAYDKTELQDMAQRLRRDQVTWLRKFDQGNERAAADKQLYDLIRDRRIMHGGEPDLAQHIQNAGAEVNKQENKLRLVKRSEKLKIDAAVALSMACAEALRLNL